MTKLRRILLLILLLSGIYLYALPQANISYVGIVLLHLVAGVLFVVTLPSLLVRSRPTAWNAMVGWLMLSAGGVLGLALMVTGAARPYRGWLYLHILFTTGGVFALILRPRRSAIQYAFILLAAVAIGGAAWWLREVTWIEAHQIRNPELAPADMNGEGDGPQGPFFPSSNQTADGELIPSEFFMKSDACKRCHADIFEQWSSSAHRFSSFNNQWYRKSIEYMQDVVGTQPSKWCGGCHDPALLLTGMMDTPVKQILGKPEAHAGLGCVACHSVTAVKSTMGQGDLVMAYPALHKLANSENKYVQALHDFVVNVNPEPHRRTFMKPFIRNQTADFCSSCHKVHLDAPVNNYRWIRGFNDYDNWQASAVSGHGARSFYYPPKPQRCVDCHMPLVPSNDAGNVDGMVHSHRFPGANTALPIVNEDPAQLEATEKFLKDGILTVDIFGISPTRAMPADVQAAGPQLSTTFAVGEEAEVSPAAVDVPEIVPLTAPIDRVNPTVRRGDTVRVDVVVRTRKIGHFFPGGTVDAFDVWLELIATDEKGQILFWSGKAEDDGRGPVEKGAHFYRSLQVDAHGNPINKRNAWASRALVYVRLIPPGAADTVHYRLQVPSHAGDKINLKAKLHYRKFSWWNTQFAFAGIRDPHAAKPTPDFDDAKWSFEGDTRNVSGKLKQIPNLPIVTIAEDTVTLNVSPANTAAAEPVVTLNSDDWERWNDYGIGLLLQGDLKSAEAAFLNVTTIAPQNPDGWVNIGRVRVQEGNLAGAKEVLERALQLAPDLARANYFYARALRGEGRYDRALELLKRVIAQYPRDRVVRNDAGRILFLQKKFAEAIQEFEHVLSIDPEDVQAHYNLMLCYTGLGQEDPAREHQVRYMRFKADESAQAITGPYRLKNPEDNNERQAIHEHVSVALPSLKK